MPQALVALPFGVLIGLLLGLVGGGCSILAVPVLVYVLGEPPAAATTESLVVVGSAAIVGATSYLRSDQVDVRTALTFALAGAAGTVPGTAANRVIGDQALLLGFATVLALAAVAVLRPEPERARRFKDNRSLAARDGLSQAEPSRVVAIEPPTMVRTIDRMVRDRLVTRAPDPDDGRLTRIHLTERGRSLRDELIPKAIAVNTAGLGRLTPTEGRTLPRLLGKLVSQPDRWWLR